MSLSGTFQFVRIPADSNEPIEVCTADKAGGLTNDALVQHAKQYFYEQSGAQARAQQLAQASPQERQALAAKIRSQLAEQHQGNTSQIEQMDDEAVLEILSRSQMQPSCDITALTVPMAGNGHMAVSLYASDHSSGASDDSIPLLNQRATALVTACGHGAGEGIRGDVFVGRAHDDEVGDVWSRVDFTVADADPGAEWCRVARGSGGGGGQGGAKAASSLSNLVAQQQQAMSGGGGTQVIDTGAQGGQQLYGLNGAPAVREAWGSWTQTDDEVELKFSVASGTKAKYCKVNFARNQLKVAVAGQVLLQGRTFDPLVPDECTYTLQDEAGGRELCLTLTKAETGRTWSFVVANN